MKSIVLDTSVVIDFLRQKNSAETWLKQIASQGYQLLLPTLVLAELYSGKQIWRLASAKARLDEFVELCTTVDFSPRAAVLSGKIRVEHELGMIDACIAAVAIQVNSPLATLNRRHFEKVENLNLLERLSSVTTGT